MAQPSHADGITEFHLTHGELTTPAFVNGGKTRADTLILTLQNASVWAMGSTFFFVDYLDDDNDDSFNNGDFYAELYASLSLGQLLDKTIGFGPIKDVGLIAGLNLAGDAKSRKFLPGLRFSWDTPKGSLLNTDITGYQDFSKGLAEGGAPSQTDSYMVDFNGFYNFSLGSQRFALTGHVEYIGARKNELGNDVAGWLLAQPQFRWDLGHALFERPNELFVGIEYQYWDNKLGEAGTRDSVPQLLLVWRP